MQYLSLFRKFKFSLSIDSNAWKNNYSIPGLLFLLFSEQSIAGQIKLLEQSVNGSNYIAIKAADSLSADTTFVWPSNGGDLNQFLTTDGAGNLSWTTGGSSGVSAVLGSGPLSSSGGSSPSLSISQANGTTGGYLTATDWLTFNSKLGSATIWAGDVSGTYNSNFIVAGAVTSTKISDASVGVGKMFSSATQKLFGRFSASSGPGEEISIGSGLSLSGAGVLTAAGGGGGVTAQAISDAGGFLNGGNKFGANASIGTTDNRPLSILTNNTPALSISQNGYVGIGTANPAALFQVYYGGNTLFQVDAAGGWIMTNPILSNDGKWELLWNNGLSMASDVGVNFSSTTLATGSKDVGIWRSAAGVLEVNNGTAGTFRDIRVRSAGVAAAPVANVALNVGGQIKGGFLSHSSLNTDWSSGNIQTTSVAAGSLTFTSGTMCDGASYILILTATGTFTLPTTGDITSWKCNPVCTSNQIVANGHTVLTIIKAGTVGYLSWGAGYQ
jgi:hypothetical protein